MHSALKPSTQNLACSRRQIHTVHTCNLSQAKATKGRDKVDNRENSHAVICPNKQRYFERFTCHSTSHPAASMFGSQWHLHRISTSMSGNQYHVHRISTPMSGSIDVRQSEPRTPHQYIDVQ